jgi:phosphoribosylformylglycinamidine synthase subunit PurSL
MLWEVDIYPATGEVDRVAARITAEVADLGLDFAVTLSAAHGYLLQGDLSESQVAELSQRLLYDPLVETAVWCPVGDPRLAEPQGSRSQLVHVLLKPGVMDPTAQTAEQILQDLGYPVQAVRRFRKYWLDPLDEPSLRKLSTRVLANDSIEQVLTGPLQLTELELGSPYSFERITVPIRSLDDEGLMRLSREGQLYLSLAEMQTIQQRFQAWDRDPTDIELETLAQTWSEHCSHKTLAGRIAYRDERGERQFDNMLKETIFAATQQIRKNLGDQDWCVSVFKDNAGVIRFDEDHNVVFKVETHNHPSAIEPYGGANTGLGGVIRDPLGTGMGAKPICNTDVFCFAPPDTPATELPPGVLHPRRVMKGVVSGVRDYGNRMGIPTVNGAIYFDPRYLGNPLVYCGNVGILPHDKSFKEPKAGDWIVAIGGRTGRDGIHGATFSSAELTSESETISGGAVQIGNAITEKMVLDVLLAARDQNLYHAVTDCGAGGFSSAVGEMGEEIGAEVWLERAPLKYEGLSYTEIWISEAQERMVLSVSPEQWEPLAALCEREGVEATILGKFVPTGQLRLLYHGEEVGNLPMEFLHGGRPAVIRDAHYQPPETRPLQTRDGADPANSPDPIETLTRILGSLNVASKEWVIRQYDHEVQGGSVIKPLVGKENDGPGDAAVVRPRLDSWRGVAISCGMNPYFGDFDTGEMAAGAMDEAIRNCVAVGADPEHIAILDNFCWGYTDRPETLGSLVRAAVRCHDTAIELGTPFISGKDSLNNEFSFERDGQRHTIAIPPTLLISAIGIVPDVRQAITMDLKSPGNKLYLLGRTREELGGSHLSLVRQLVGGQVPGHDASEARKLYGALHGAIRQGLVRSCHDLSEGGLAVAVAEMAFAGGWGANVRLATIPWVDALADASAELSAVAELTGRSSGENAGDPHVSRNPVVTRDEILLFSESNSRLVCEVAPEAVEAFEQAMAGLPMACIGDVIAEPALVIESGESDRRFTASLPALKHAWQSPLAWS